ncbi:MAG: hypothetical protein HHJ09_04605 [Glaciimonas sp.]|nr:hypothetical protein [Glaciimonas sp.]
MSFFDATKEFDAAIGEIDYLLTQAELSQSIPIVLEIYIKASIVLLTAKIESFSENILEEFVDKLAEKKLKYKKLPKQLKIHSTSFLLKDLIGSKPFSAKSNAISKLVEAASLWNDDEVFSALSVNYKFDYGKHGSSEFKNFFNRVGIENICDKCRILTDNESMLTGLPQKKDISGDIDSLTNIRNNIIHTDATPSSITYQQVRGYRENLWEFCYLIDLHLQIELERLTNS